MYSFERLAWYQSPALHQGALVVALLPLLIGLIGWPIAAAVRARLGRSSPPRAATAARLIAAGTALVLIAYTVAFFILTGDSGAFNQALFLGDSPMLTVVRVLSTLGIAGAIVTSVYAVIAWVRGWWGPVGRLHYSLATVGAVLFLAVCTYYNMLGFALW